MPKLATPLTDIQVRTGGRVNPTGSIRPANEQAGEQDRAVGMCRVSAKGESMPGR